MGLRAKLGTTLASEYVEGNFCSLGGGFNVLRSTGGKAVVLRTGISLR